MVRRQSFRELRPGKPWEWENSSPIGDIESSINRSKDDGMESNGEADLVVRVTSFLLATPLCLLGLTLAAYNIVTNHGTKALLVPLKMLLILVVPSVLAMVSSVNPNLIARLVRAPGAAGALIGRLPAYALPVVCVVYWSLVL